VATGGVLRVPHPRGLLGDPHLDTVVAGRRAVRALDPADSSTKYVDGPNTTVENPTGTPLSPKPKTVSPPPGAGLPQVSRRRTRTVRFCLLSNRFRICRRCSRMTSGSPTALRSASSVSTNRSALGSSESKILDWRSARKVIRSCGSANDGSHHTPSEAIIAARPCGCGPCLCARPPHAGAGPPGRNE
jgi:hypothetical protein